MSFALVESENAVASRSINKATLNILKPTTLAGNEYLLGIHVCQCVLKLEEYSMQTATKTQKPAYSQFSVRHLFNQSDAPEAMTVEGFSDTTNPAIPTKDDHYVFRKDTLRNILGFLKMPSGDAMYITGPTGSGKTSLVCEVAARLNWPVQNITAHGRMEWSELVGHHALKSKAPGDTPSMDWVYGPLAIAMKYGHIFLLNEIDLIDPAEVSGMNDILEGRPLMLAENGGEIIKPHPKFRVIVTGNSTGSGDESGLYQGIMMQNLAAMDRYRFMKVDYADEEVEKDVLKRKVPSIPDEVSIPMIKVANEVRKSFVGDSTENNNVSVTLSTRTLIRWATLASQYKKAPNALEYALDQALLIRANATDRAAILRMAKDVYGDLW